jgi:RNA polymerase sigma factor (sigma-70 family)
MTHLSSPEASDSLERLLAKLEPRVNRLFVRFGVPTQDAEDLLQEALLGLVSSPEQIHNPEQWLMGTLRNRCLLYWRRRRRALYQAMDTALLEASAKPCPGDQERSDVRRDLEILVSRLPERCRSIFHLRYRVGCENSEMAQQLGYRAASLRMITLRCLSALTRHLVAAGYCGA